MAAPHWPVFGGKIEDSHWSILSGKNEGLSLAWRTGNGTREGSRIWKLPDQEGLLGTRYVIDVCLFGQEKEFMWSEVCLFDKIQNISEPQVFKIAGTGFSDQIWEAINYSF